MRVCIIDTETTGLDTKKDNVIELGAVITDTKTWLPPEECFNMLINQGYTPLPKVITQIIGITDDLLETQGVRLADGLNEMLPLLESVDCFVAHNAEFDKEILINDLDRNNLMSDVFRSLPWVCTVKDVRHSKNVKCKTLSHMALDYGLDVDPNTLHRAMDDCLLLARVMQQRGINFEEDYNYYMTPKMLYVAKPKPPWEDGGKQRDLATSLGFSWNRVAKQWEGFFVEGHEFGPTPFKIIEGEL